MLSITYEVTRLIRNMKCGPRDAPLSMQLKLNNCGRVRSAVSLAMHITSRHRAFQLIAGDCIISEFNCIPKVFSLS